MFRLKGLLKGFVLSSCKVSLLSLFVLVTLFPAPAGHAAALALAWDPNPESNLAGYELYYGPAPRFYDQVVDVGNQTNYLLTVPDDGKTYYMAVVAYDDAGNQADFSQELSWTTLAANVPPVADIQVSKAFAEAAVVSFDAAGSHDPDGTITSYVWSFGDGTSGAGAYIEHTYAAAKTYTVSLLVTDDEGATAQAATAVQVVAGANAPPTAVIVANVLQEGAARLGFDGSASSDPDGIVREYQWDFGDGSSESGMVVEHEFANGDYAVTLTVKDDEGAAAQARLPVTVTDQSLWPVEFAVNFQPADVATAPGYAPDYGQEFTEARRYGWSQLAAAFRLQDRDSSLSPDQAYDTLIYVSPKSAWELALPNGRYAVTICMGDPVYPLGVQDALVEGLAVIDGEALDRTTRWLEREVIVDIIDGRLTLTFGDRNRFVRLNWLRVKQLAAEIAVAD